MWSSQKFNPNSNLPSDHSLNTQVNTKIAQRLQCQTSQQISTWGYLDPTALPEAADHPDKKNSYLHSKWPWLKRQCRKTRIFIQVNGLKICWCLYLTRSTHTRSLYHICTKRPTHDPPQPWIATTPGKKGSVTIILSPKMSKSWKRGGKHHLMMRTSSN